jgi:hypothetical protein
MRFRNPIFGILSVVVVGLLIHLFRETGWAIFIERLLEEAAHSLGIERAAMVATLPRRYWALACYGSRCTLPSGLEGQSVRYRPIPS